MRDFSKFKVLGITLLVTMSSCVVGSVDLNAESLRAYGLEFDISVNEKTYSVQKSKKSKFTTNSKFRFLNIIESGRAHVLTKSFSFNYSPVIFQLKHNHFQIPLLNIKRKQGSYTYASLYHGLNQQNRAGPFLLSC
ncbi:hypothetical protein E9993_06715 [Labilibacter sediminis]|nr:hypothetical protein E9993_06715 [Labilibacter sediminis]